jgi:hypothetical protein
MLKWWPLFGIRRHLTEKKAYTSPIRLQSLYGKLFQRSLFIYILDVGSSNALNFEISALESPQYNIHRFGIYFTDSPRHADVLLILGRPTESMLAPMNETLNQMPEPYYVITIDDSMDDLPMSPYPEMRHHVAQLKGIPSPSELLGLLLELIKNKRIVS